MTNRYARFAGAVIVVSGMLALAPADAAAQSSSAARAKPAPRAWTPPKTPWGEPDLQGVYSNKTITPFERPAEFAGKAELTGEETAELERRVADRSADKRDAKGTDSDVSRAYNEFWWDRGTKVTTNRSSLIIDPADGRVPPLTPEAQRRAEEEWRQPIYRGGGANGRGADWTTDRSLFERCITRGLPGAMSPTAYNNNYRIVQSPGYVAIQIEMLGGARLIPTSGGAHVHGSLRQYMGDSRGHWEGSTLVVETTNFTNRTLYRGAAENLTLVERFTRVDPDTLEYQFTVTDPTTFVRPWTASVPYLRTDEQLFEYACHEGNYGMEGILSGARVEEAK
ncbi:MAG: hypothetical protein ABI868_05170 [Acidobacteriota bacterium]